MARQVGNKVGSGGIVVIPFSGLLHDSCTSADSTRCTNHENDE